MNDRRLIVAPTPLPGEVVNALYQRVRTSRPEYHLTEEEAQGSLAAFLGLPITIAAPPGVYGRALAFARDYGLSASYDSIYVALAEMTGTELWTADTQLLRSLNGSAPWVRFIGDYPLR